MYKNRITVFTPTYNRAYSLTCLYESLKVQSFHNFEWLIVDDGSNDNTNETVNNFISENPFFVIKYLKTENGGKHRAINHGIGLADGELLLVMDSDDWLRKDALELIDKIEKTIPLEEKDKYAGVYGLRVHADKKLIGTTFLGDILDSTYLERGKYNITGDKAEVYYTNVLKKYPFPEFEGENFCTECLVWDKMAADGYKLRFFNEGIYYCEYLEDGLTKKGNALYAKNPKQYGLYVHNNWIYKKQDRFHSMIKIYEYYLYERNRLSFKEIKDYLKLPYKTILFSIVIQWFTDLFRIYFHKGITIRKSVQKSLINKIV